MSFAVQLTLLRRFLTERTAIVERIERSLLNVRGKDLTRSRHRAQFARLLDACFFGMPGLPRELIPLKGELAARYRADGFEPVQLDAYANELDPLELVVRAYGHWDATRWPGSAGRLAYAQVIFAVFVIRQLEYLSLRVWDDGRDRAAEHLAAVQTLLDSLNGTSTSGVFVRDARWLIQTALGPFTKHLRPYFGIADHVAASFADAGRQGIHSAGVMLGGGHLRSQLRYRMWQTRLPIDHPENLAFTRNSNALDNSLLVRDMVPSMRAYRAACAAGDARARIVLADIILQGLAADPDLFVARLDLLTPYTLIEPLFIEPGDGHPARYTALGGAQLAQHEEYARLLGEIAGALRADADHLNPGACGYSPLGITYGFCADVMSNMASDALVGQSAFGLSLEDIFVSGDRSEEKLARARGWERLPRRPGENPHFEYSAEFANQLFAWVTRTLQARASRPADANVSRHRSSHIFVTVPGRSGDPLPALSPEGVAPADEYRLDADAGRAAETGATSWPALQLQTDRMEGRLLASAIVDGSWMGISKILLTRIVGEGRDGVLTNIPQDIATQLELTCAGLLVLCRQP